MSHTQQVEQAYFKEYPTLHFNFTTHHTQPRTPPAVSFTHSLNGEQRALPSALLDGMAPRETLYLLHWQEREDGWVVAVKELSSQQWLQVSMNLLPEEAVISGGNLYLRAGRQLAIVPIEEGDTTIRDIACGKVVGMGASAVEYYPAQFEPGVSLAIFEEDRGYQLRHYSPRRLSEQEQQPLTKLLHLISPKKYLPFRSFHLIVPSLFAVAFTDQRTFFIFDLLRGQIIQNTKGTLISCKLSPAESALIRWREHIAPEGYSKSLILTIAVGNNIELFFLYLTYRPQFTSQLSNASLLDIHGASVMNWAEAQLAPFLSLTTPGIVLDLGISKKGILYYCKEGGQSQIGHCSYVDLNWVMVESPILTQQAAVWRNYYQDREFPDPDGSRLYIPNRYPPQLVAQVLQQEEETRPALLAAWRREYAFKGVIIYGEEMLIVRRGSLSVFRFIPPTLFHFESFTENSLNVLQEIECQSASATREVQSVYSKSDSEFNEPLLRGEGDRPIPRERRYGMSEEDGCQEGVAMRRAQQQFEDFLNQLQIVTGDGSQETYSTMSITQFQRPLALGLLYDQLSHFHLTANTKAFRVPPSGQRQGAKEYQLQSCVVRLLNYYYGLLHRAEAHFLAFGDNIIGVFTGEHPQCLSADVDKSVLAFLKLLLRNLLPQRAINYGNSQINPDDHYHTALTNNPYIDFLVDSTIRAIKEERAGQAKSTMRAKLLREQLGKVLQIGFLDARSIYFSCFWRNTSLFRAALLSSCPRLPSYLHQYLLRGDVVPMQAYYSGLKEYMLPQQVQSVENILFFNQQFHNLPVDMQLLASFGGQPSSSELERYPQVIGSLKRNIYAQDAPNRSRTDTNRQGNAALAAIDDFSKTPNFDRTLFIVASDRMAAVSVNDQQEHLQFLEKLLGKWIKIFNSRVAIPQWTPLGDETPPEQQITLRNKNQELRGYLSLIEQCFHDYRRTYSSVYGQSPLQEERESHQTDLQRQHCFQMTIMKQRFIDPTNFLFSLGGNTQGAICCSITLRLLREALDHFGDSLQVRENLIGFWLGSVCSSRDWTEAALILEVSCWIGREAVGSYLRINEQAKTRVGQIIEHATYEGNYEFMGVLKEIL